MTYAVEFVRSARKELSKLPKDTQKTVLRGILALSAAPRSGSVRKMVGDKSWRLRVGDYRVIYEIQDKQLLILVIKIGHRQNVYKK